MTIRTIGIALACAGLIAAGLAVSFGGIELFEALGWAAR